MIFSYIFDFIPLLRPGGRCVKRLTEGCDEPRERDPRALHCKLHVFTQRDRRGHPTVVDLAEVEDEATCEDRRDAGQRATWVSEHELRWGRSMAHGSRKIVM